jgi:DNA primase
VSKGYSRQDIIDSGAVGVTDDGRLVDAQAGRLIFPIINALDEVIAFGGRVLKKVDYGKYKNTKDTLIFNKSKSLYNINLLKKLKRTQTVKNIILVEGYMDTLSLYQSGFKNVVASMGTSLTQEQARLLKRYTDTVLISYDGDGAGQKANMRGLEILKGEGLNVKVVPLPDGPDPDDIIKQNGVEAYQALLDASMPLIDYKLKVLKKGFDLKKPEDKRRYVTEAIKIIRTAESSAEQEDLLKNLRDETGITYESLNRDLHSLPMVEEPKKQTRVERSDNATAIQKASRFVIASFLFEAKYTEDADITEIEFDDDVHTILAKYVLSKKLMEEKMHLSELFEFFEENTPEYDELTRILDYSDGQGFDGVVAEKTFKDCVKKLKINSFDKKINALSVQLIGEKEIPARQSIATQISSLLKQKEKIKNGEQR